MRRANPASRPKNLATADFSWHLAVLAVMQQWITEAGHPLDKVTISVIQRRLINLERFVERIPGVRSIYEQAPFAADDAAALILWPKYKALRVARALFDRSQVEMYEDMTINMDWFYHPLDNSGGHSDATRGARANPSKPKARTYAVARAEILRALQQEGWDVRANLKMPHATYPRGGFRLWFKTQAIYESHGSETSSFAGAHSLWIGDIRTMPVEDVLAYIERVRKSS